VSLLHHKAQIFPDEQTLRARNKLEHGNGLSFAEFSYPLLQAWDWWHMFSTKGIQMQIGGSDQFGNIVAGIDAINYITKSRVATGAMKPGLIDEQELSRPVGFTVPLMTTASGQKFGKSAGNAVWLDKEMRSTFDLYGVRPRSFLKRRRCLTITST
jgi:tyrosyl-tRNA synthetase